MCFDAIDIIVTRLLLFTEDFEPNAKSSRMLGSNFPYGSTEHVYLVNWCLWEGRRRERRQVIREYDESDVWNLEAAVCLQRFFCTVIIKVIGFA